MKFYNRPSKEIPIIADVDVLVIGGGPAGFSAAVCAAREGASVMLVEQTSDIGGVATSGLMSHWTGKTRGGFYEEILNHTFSMCTELDSPLAKDKAVINHEVLKNWMLKTLEDSGVIIRLYTFASDVIMEGSKVKGVVIESKSGTEAINAKVVVDCTGDGDIAEKAGVEYTKGREADGVMQTMSLMFQIGGVDLSKVTYVYGFEDSYQAPKGDIQTLARQALPSPAGHVLVYPSAFPGVVTLNMTNVTDVDGTRAEDLTKAYIECRKQLPLILNFLKENAPGFENAYILRTASYIGVRETRHFVGMKTINEQDILSARVFDDWAVANAHFNFDVHNITGAGLDETGVQKHFPQKVDGLMLAGRNISGTHMAHSNFRVMPICANMGQAVGIAAALCTKSNVEPHELDVKELQKVLIAQGVKP